jgi:hypothetical protein
MANAKPYFDAIKAVIGDAGVRKYIGEISYHRYSGVDNANLQWIGTTARAYGIGASMLEHIGSGYEALHEDLKVGNNTAWAQYTLAYPTSDNGAQYFPVAKTDNNAPKILWGERTKYLKQYFKYIRSGATRIEATSQSSGADPLAFVNKDRGHVVVVKTAGPMPLVIRDLPAGSYGIRYTVEGRSDVAVPDQTITPGQALTTAIPARGVITIYALPRSAAQAGPARGGR